MPKILYNPEVLEHRPKSYHVENPERVITILDSLKSNGFEDIILIEGKSTIDEVLEIHSKEYVDSIIKLSSAFNYYDGDTYLCTKTLDAALTAFKLAKEAVNLALNDKDLYFALTRPPGHHAEKNKAMGFCIYNNVAVGAHYLIEKYKFNKIAIVDFDVHHGNGTQDIFHNNKKVLYISTHQYPYYPGTGTEQEKGKYNNIFNIPLPAGTTSEEYLNAYGFVLKKLKEFKDRNKITKAVYNAYFSDLNMQIETLQTKVDELKQKLDYRECLISKLQTELNKTRQNCENLKNEYISKINDLNKHFKLFW